MTTQASPNMNLVLPVVGSELGPAWANELFTALYSVVDQHNHTAGKGVLIPSAALGINADLPFAGFNATGLRTVRLNLQGANPSLGADINVLYSGPTGDLWYNNNAGTQIRITSGGAVFNPGNPTGLVGPVTGTQRTVTTTYTIDSISGDYCIFADTTGGAFTTTLPVATAGRVLRIFDSKGHFAVANLTLAPHGVEKINGIAANKVLSAAWSDWEIISNGTDWFVSGS